MPDRAEVVAAAIERIYRDCLRGRHGSNAAPGFAEARAAVTEYLRDEFSGVAKMVRDDTRTDD